MCCSAGKSGDKNDSYPKELIKLKYTILDYAYDVLKSSDIPLTYNDIGEKGKSEGYASQLTLTGKTPWNTLSARLFVEVRDNRNESRFVKVGSNPARFFLKENLHLIDDEIPDEINEDEQKQNLVDVEKYIRNVIYTRFFLVLLIRIMISIKGNPFSQRQFTMKNQRKQDLMNGSILIWLDSIFPLKNEMRNYLNLIKYPNIIQ